MKRAVTRAAVAVASTKVAGRVADRTLERPRTLVATAQQAGIDALALLRTEAELAQIEVQENLPGLVRSGAVLLFGFALVAITPALLVTAGVLWLGPEIGYAGAALLFALVGGLTGLLIARAGVGMMKQVSLVPRESLARIERELGRIGETLNPSAEPDALAEPDPEPRVRGLQAGGADGG